MVELEELPLQSALADALGRPPRAGYIAVDWLGQAGFAIRGGGRLLIIDPYLSDSLAEKYRGKELPHARMMPSPLAPEAARGVDAVLCTHKHTDHMDPGTLPAIARTNPSCLFVAPRAEKVHAVSIGVPELRLRTIDAGETLHPVEGIQVEAIPAAHEELARNNSGEMIHLGYIVTVGGIRLYHSGDCIPYDGLEETLHASAIDVALLPVNGRSKSLTARGIIGNFHLEEAIQICRTAGIQVLFCHHWGLFDFNTIDPRQALEKIRQLAGPLRCIMPRVGVSYLLRKT